MTMSPLSLLCCNQSQTVLSHLKNKRCYLPFGFSQPGLPCSGFNGQWAEPVRQIYILGNGYRPYFPGFMRFTSADLLSPFGKGGINSYAYAGAEPINRTDPTGRMWKALKTLGSFIDDGWTLNVRKVAPEISVHDDLYKGFNRLNINAHGRPGSVKLYDTPADGELLYQSLRAADVNFQDYRYIRLLSCHSAEMHPFSGSQPIPAVLAERTGLPVKGYRGTVTVRNDVGDLQEALASGRPYRVNPKGGYDIRRPVYIVKNRDDAEYHPQWFYPESFYR